ncbi:MAG: hypothetical protein KGJ98_08890 [Chloroflexota bacterium]|nr:hypothetical protein [Chloroflexota bacterium]
MTLKKPKTTHATTATIVAVRLSVFVPPILYPLRHQGVWHMDYRHHVEGCPVDAIGRRMDVMLADPRHGQRLITYAFRERIRRHPSDILRFYGPSMRVLEVDLSTNSTHSTEIPQELTRAWLGGAGLAMYLLAQEIRPGIRPSDPDCPALVFTGPLTGTAVPQSSDWCVVTVNSEVPHHICASHTHGHFGARLRQAGWDGIVLRGQAPSPVCLWVADDGVEIVPADDLWGLDTYETEDSLTRLLGRPANEVSVACIGPAGEQLVAGASVRNDRAFGASQGGAGVAWGSKRLKAVVVASRRSVPAHDPSRLVDVAERWKQAIRGAIPGFPESRYASGLSVLSALAANGSVMGKNLTDPAVAVRWGERLAADLPQWEVEPVGSWNCEALCHYHAKCTTGPMSGASFSGYGGEVMEELGPNLGIEDPGVSFTLSGVIDAYGLAAGSVPRTISMLMEATNAGEIGPAELDGIDLRWGNHEAVLDLLKRTVRRDGVGELLAKGMRETARTLGIEHRSVHMHGAGFNDHDQRATPMVLFQSQVASGAGPTWQTAVGLAFGFAAEPDLGFPKALDPDDLSRVVEATYKTQQKKLWLDCLGVCMFAARGFGGMFELGAEALEAATGMQWRPEDALVVGRRVVNLQRLINIHLGYVPEEDFDISQRLLEKIAEGPAAGRGLTRAEFSRLREEFYRMQDWSIETGWPSDELLRELGLDPSLVGRLVPQ